MGAEEVDFPEQVIDVTVRGEPVRFTLHNTEPGFARYTCSANCPRPNMLLEYRAQWVNCWCAYYAGREWYGTTPQAAIDHMEEWYAR